MLSKVYSVAWLVILDGLRRRALLGLILFAISLEAGGLLFFQFIPREIGRASVDFILSVGWLTGFLFLLFHAVKITAREDERRIVECILSRPLSRAHYVIGTFSGLTLLLFLLNVTLGLIGLLILYGIKNSVGLAYFANFYLAHYILSWLGLFTIELLVLSVIVLFSSIVRGGFPVLLLTVAYCLICNGLPVVREVYDRIEDASGLLISQLLKGLSAIFPDFSRYDYRELVVSSDLTLTAKMMFISVIMAILYQVVVLWISSIIFSRRDLQ